MSTCKAESREQKAEINPWSQPAPKGWGISHVTTCEAQSRLAKIKESTDIAWLRQVLAWADNQLAVRLAAERRLRKLATAPKV